MSCPRSELTGQFKHVIELVLIFCKQCKICLQLLTKDLINNSRQRGNVNYMQQYGLIKHMRFRPVFYYQRSVANLMMFF